MSQYKKHSSWVHKLYIFNTCWYFSYIYFRFCIFKRNLRSMNILENCFVCVCVCLLKLLCVYNFQNWFMWVSLLLGYFLLPYKSTFMLSKFITVDTRRPNLFILTATEYSFLPYHIQPSFEKGQCYFQVWATSEMLTCTALYRCPLYSIQSILEHRYL